MIYYFPLILTLARASLAASASVAMALCRWTGNLTSFLKYQMAISVDYTFIEYISTLSTFTPQGSVASSRTLCMVWAMASLSAITTEELF